MKNRFMPVPSAEFSSLLETALRRIVQADSLAAWTNENCDYSQYEAAARCRDAAIEAAAELINRIDYPAARAAAEQAYADIGADPAIDCDNFETLTAEQLRDEEAYIADFQG